MRTIALFFTLLGLAACGGGGGGGGGAIPGSELPALTGGQKDRMTTVSVEAQSVSEVAEGYGPQQQQPITQGTFNPFDNSEISRLQKSPDNSKVMQAEIEKDLDQAFNQGDCTLTMVPDNMQQGGMQTPENIEVGFKIETSKGAFSACPISYKNTNKISSEGSETNSVVTTVSVVDYRLTQGTDLYDAMDVVAFSMDMNSAVRTTATNQNSASMSMDMGGKGILVSKSEGEVGVKLAMSGSGNFSANQSTGGVQGSMNMSFTYTVEFSDFKAVGHSKVNMKMNGQNTEVDAKFYVNGRSVSEEEFNELFQQETSASVSGSIATVGR